MNIFDVVEEQKSKLSAENFNKLWDTVTGRNTRSVLKEVVINLGDKEPSGNEFAKTHIQRAINVASMVHGFNAKAYKESIPVLISVKVIYEGALQMKDPDQVFKDFYKQYLELEKAFQ